MKFFSANSSFASKKYIFNKKFLFSSLKTHQSLHLVRCDASGLLTIAPRQQQG